MKHYLKIKLAFLFVVFCNIFVDISHKIILQNIAFKIFDGPTQVIWISIINLLIITPFILFFSFSGYLSDRFNKKDVLIYGALSSFCLSILILIAYFFANFYLAMFFLFCLAIQSAIYSPAKFGIIIDIYGKEKIALGNSHLQAVSIIAILFTMALFSYAFESFYIANNLSIITNENQLLSKILPLALFIVPVAFLELLISFLVLKKLKIESKKSKAYVFNLKRYIKADLLAKNIKHITSNHIIFLSIIALSVFWAISQGMIAVFPSYAKEYLNIQDVFIINTIIASSGVGIALGSYFYSRYSKHYIEVGTIPIASIALAITIFTSTILSSPIALIINFVIFGFFGGLFVVPLNSLIQFNSKKIKLGTILAGSNWVQSIFMFAILLMTTTVSYYNLDTLYTIYILLCITIIGALYTIISIPQSMILFFLKWIVGLKYKLEVSGIDNIDSNKGVLLLGNHVSWIDWAIIYMATPREIKFVMDKPIYDKWYLKWILRFFKAIPISATTNKKTLYLVANELDKGNVVVIFPEGAITRNGHLGEFKRGFEKILSLTSEDVDVVAFYIRGLWESMFSRANKKFIQNRRTNMVTVSFSTPIKKHNATANRIKNEILSLSTTAWIEHISYLQTVPCEIFNRLKQLKTKTVITDSTLVTLSAYKFLTAAIVFKDLFKRYKEECVAVMIPASAAGAFINTSLLMLGKKVVNVNYTASFDVVVNSLKKAEVKRVITSKKFLEKLKDRGINLDDLKKNFTLVILEEEKKKISKIKALTTLLSVVVLPTYLLKKLHIKNVSKDSTALIMFSSGSENTPKAIELSHDNIVGNCSQIANVLNVKDDDVILGSLPLFHAFGIVVTTFLPLMEGVFTVCSADPTDSQTVAKQVSKFKVTVMFGTSTFFRLYTRSKKVHPLMFESLRIVIAGAEKLSEKVANDFFKKFNKEILEGYGTTETSPVATCNLPNIIASNYSVQKGTLKGSVGMPIPGTMVKIVEPNSFKSLKANEEGMVLISGIQVMKGYLKDEVLTQKVIKKLDGRIWYVTGDKGKLNKDGFLTIVDRYSRFAKLGGEMISLSFIEKKIEELINPSDEIEIAASSMKDEKKGEKVVLLLSNIDDKKLNELKIQIRSSFENKLLIPSEYKVVEYIPKLGSGKMDFKAINKLASNEV